MVDTAFGGGEIFVVGAVRGLDFDEQALEPLVFRQAEADLVLELLDVLLAVTLARGNLGSSFFKLAVHVCELSFLGAELHFKGLNLLLGALMGFLSFVDSMMREFEGL